MTDLTPPVVDAASAAAAATRFAQRAAARGDAPVTYATLDSPVGRLVAVRTEAGLAMLSYEDHHGGVEKVLDTVALRLSPKVLEAPAQLDDVRRQLEQYFAGERTTFALPLDWSLTTPFTRRILQATCNVPFGATATYGQVAAEAGNANASRAAGRALGSNPIPIVVPCHRIIGTSGKLTGYTGGLDRKIALLELEGLVFGA